MDRRRELCLLLAAIAVLNVADAYTAVAALSLSRAIEISPLPLWLLTLGAGRFLAIKVLSVTVVCLLAMARIVTHKRDLPRWWRWLFILMIVVYSFAVVSQSIALAIG